MARTAAIDGILNESEYLSLEESAESRSEFIAGRVFAMAGGTDTHIQISFNMTRLLADRLRGKCRVYQSDMKVRVGEADAFFYPDVTLVCGDQKFYRGRRDIIENPVLLVEVLSDSTHEYDKNDKLFAYQTIPSFREYVLISQKKHVVQQYIRQPDGNWRIKATIGAESTIYLESVEVELAMEDIYDLVEFD